jgi:hypothetical protein
MGRGDIGNIRTETRGQLFGKAALAASGPAGDKENAPHEQTPRSNCRTSHRGGGMVGQAERFIRGRRREPFARRWCLIPRRPTFKRSVWLFRSSRNHSCGTARDLHPFPPYERRHTDQPVHRGVYIEFRKKKIGANIQAEVLSEEYLRGAASRHKGRAGYLQAKKVT